MDEDYQKDEKKSDGERVENKTYQELDMHSSFPVNLTSTIMLGEQCLEFHLYLYLK